MLLCKLSRSTAPHTCPAIEDNLFVCGRLLKTKSVLKLFLGQEQGVWLGFDGQVDCAGNVSSFVLGRFTDVYTESMIRIGQE